MFFDFKVTGMIGEAVGFQARDQSSVLVEAHFVSIIDGHFMRNNNYCTVSLSS